jgi:hypothetical protein
MPEPGFTEYAVMSWFAFWMILEAIWLIQLLIH